MPTHRLSIIEADRAIEPQGVASKARRRFLDFAVDGDPLYDGIRGRGLDCISPLWLDDSTARAFAVDSARRLLGELDGDAPDGRVSVYVCAECGDLGCGAVTVRLRISEDSVVWEDWGWQTNYSEAVDALPREGIDDIVFERTEYEQVLREAIRTLEAP
jgi:hypothetical protein